MKTIFLTVSRRLLLPLCAVSFLLTVTAHTSQAQTADTWAGGTDNWSNSGLWSAGVPDSVDAQVFIDGGKTATASAVNVDGTRTVGALILDAGDTLTVPENTYFIVHGGTFTGSGTLTLNGTLNLSGGFRGTTLVFTSPGSLIGAGSIDLTTGSNTIRVNTAGDRLTIGAGLAIAGGGNLGNAETTFTNAGLIDANLPGNTLDIEPGGGTGDFTNTATGVLEASDGGTLYLDGRGQGTIVGGRVQALDGGQVTLDNGIIVDGATFATAGSGTVNVTGTSTARAAVITGTLGVNENTYLVVAKRVSDPSATLTNNGTLALNGGFRGTSLYFSSPGSLAGTGVVTLTGSSRVIAGNSGDRVTIGPGQTLMNAGNLGNAQTTFTNNGTVDADGSGNTLTIQPGGGASDFTNTATAVLKATNGATLLLSGSGSGTVAGGTATAFDGSQVVLGNGVTLSGATLATSGSGVATVGGSDHAFLANVTNTGLLQVPENSYAVFTGTLTNNGVIQLNGGFRGTPLIANAPATLGGTGSITLTGSSRIYANTAGDRITIGAGQTILNAGNLGAAQTTFTNNGTVNANLPGDTLSIQPGGGTADFTNAASGLLEASGGGTLFLNGDSGKFTNLGVVAAQPGSTVSVSTGALTNLANNILTGGTYEAFADNATGNPATLDFSGATFTTNAATLVLSGTNSVLAAASGLADNRGSFSLLALRQFTTTGSLSSEGTLTLDAGATLHVAGAYAGSSAATLDFLIGGSASQGVKSPGLLQINGTGTLAGTLAAGFSPGATLPAASATLTVVSSNVSLTGTFANVPDGGRLGTANGTGSFQVNYGATSAFSPAAVVLSNYTPPDAPEITSATKLTGKSGATFSYQTTATNSPTSYAAPGLPAGLSIDGGAGLVSGVPTAAGTSTFVLTAANALGTGSATLTLTVVPGPPVITSPATASGKVGSAFGYQIAATNSPTSYGAQGLPGGVTVNTATGLLSGSPTAAGTFTVALSASNANGTGTATLTLTVQPPTPVITSAASATGTVGASFTYQIAATNAPSSFNATGLPPGLAVSAFTGLISGTPTTAGTSTLTLSATNAGGTGTATLTLTIQPPTPVITSAGSAAGTVGTAFSYQITASNAPTSYGAQALPAGLSVNPGNGSISGTPAAAGTFSVLLAATNGGGTGTATLTLTIVPAAPVITSPNAASGTSGSAFSYQITATNSPTGYGAQGLPPGLSVAANTGLISGTPTAPGTSPITLTAVNAGGTGSATLTLTVLPPVPVITSATTASGTAGTAFAYQITATNNPTSYGVAGLPGGLIYNASTGLISGTPTAGGISTLALSATNGGGTGPATLTLTIAPAPVVAVPVITSALTATAAAPNPFPNLFSYQITATNNPTSFTAEGLPAGLTCYDNGLIYGYSPAAGSYTITLHATNGAGTGSATLTLTVGAGPVPVITSATTASAQTAGVFVGTFQYLITATNSPTSFAAQGLPGGLTCNATSGLVSGTPTATGTYQVTLNATNGAGTGSAALTLTVTGGGVESILPAVLTYATTGAAFSYQLAVTNHPTSYAVQGLPSGLSVNTATGLITGTFTTIGSYNVSFNAYDATGGFEQGSLIVTVTQGAAVVGTPVIISATASGQVGIAFGYQIIATNSPTTYTVTGLPGGITYNASSGVISGTPTTAGTFKLLLTAGNAKGIGAGAALALTIAAATPPVITSPATAAVTVGTSFYYQITASGNPTIYAAASLPAGLALSGSAIYGKPTTTGKFSVTLSASNSYGKGSAVLTLTVSALGLPVLTSATSVSATVAAPFSYQITATNSPTTYGASNLPAGLSLNASTGVISGTPPAAGTFTVTITATNITGKGKSTLILTASIEVAITSPASAVATVGKPFAYRITATGQPTGFSALNFPASLTINPITGVLSGTLTTAGTYTGFVEAIISGSGGTGNSGGGISLSAGSGVLQSLTITVNPVPKVNIAATVPTVTHGTRKHGPSARSLASRESRQTHDEPSGDDSAVFTVTLSDPQPDPVTVSFAIAGSAVNGSDYVAIKTTRKFAPGETSKTIRISPLGDAIGVGEKRTVALTLQPGDGYSVDTTSKVKVKIFGQ